MIVTGNKLKELALSGKVQCPIGQVFPSHIDVTLAESVLFEADPNAFFKAMDTSHALPVVDLQARETVTFESKTTPHVLRPTEFALFSIREHITVPPNMTADFYMDSRLARSCLDHTIATLMLPGWSGLLTLELKNNAKYHSLLLKEGMNIGKIVFHEHGLCEEYSGNYNNQLEVRA